MVTSSADSTEHTSLNESVEELRMRLNAMKEMMSKVDNDEEPTNSRKIKPANRESVIDGKFLSCVFLVVLFLIVIVSTYAFMNLFIAVAKKFYSKKHTEL